MKSFHEFINESSDGEAHLNGKYKIISKSVPAKHLFTDGNSVHELGYDPHEK